MRGGLMKRRLYAFLVAIFAVSFCFGQVALAQAVVSTVQIIQTGFAVITPLLEGGQGVSVAETFGQVVDGNLFQASVLSSPLVTSTSVVVNVDPSISTNTGIAIVNPNTANATITLVLRDSQGVVIAVRSFILGGQQQISRFVTQLFFGTPQF